MLLLGVLALMGAVQGRGLRCAATRHCGALVLLPNMSLTSGRARCVTALIAFERWGAPGEGPVRCGPSSRHRDVSAPAILGLVIPGFLISCALDHGLAGRRGSASQIFMLLARWVFCRSR